MSGLKGEKIWKAAYNLVNQWEEVQSECLAPTKSLSYVEDSLQGVQVSLKGMGHPPTSFLYTDSSQHA